MQSYSTDKIDIMCNYDRLIVVNKDNKIINLTTKQQNSLFSAFKNLQNVVNEVVDSLNQKEAIEKQIKVDSLVKIEKIGGSYTTYVEWLMQNLESEQYDKFIFGELPRKNDIYRVVYIGKHQYADKDLAYVKSIQTGQCYIISLDSLKVL